MVATQKIHADMIHAGKTVTVSPRTSSHHDTTATDRIEHHHQRRLLDTRRAFP